MENTTDERAFEALLAKGYLLLQPIGRGGMGRVWKARNLGLDREVAIKQLVSNTPERRGDLVREARVIAKLNHPSVVSVFELIVIDDQGPFVVMELMRGLDLEEAIERDGPLDQTSAVDVAIAIAEGLEAAHLTRLVHGDVKPGNIFLAETTTGGVRPKLIDFGIAAYMSPEKRASNDVAGTPEFMAPEQFSGQLTPGVDQWGLCISLYTAIAGTYPFSGSTIRDIYNSARSKPLPFPRQADLDPRLYAILCRGTRKDPKERYRDMSELRADLAQWRSSQRSRPGRWRVTRNGEMAVAGSSRGNDSAITKRVRRAAL